MATCYTCRARDIKPFDNGDGKTRCEPCAVEKYKLDVYLKWGCCALIKAFETDTTAQNSI